MLFRDVLPHVKSHIENINNRLVKSGHKKLSKTQQYWLGFCITGILVTGSLLWTRMQSSSLNSYKARALSWMFHSSKIAWSYLIHFSAMVVLDVFKITEGDLVVDDTDRKRSKNTKKLHGVQKTLDKETHGYVMAQELVFIILVTKYVTIPVGFDFFIVDPKLKAWKEEDKTLKEKGIKKSARPKKPHKDKLFPTKIEIFSRLLRRFKTMTQSKFVMKSILADAAYMSRFFIKECRSTFENAQVISQLKSNQMVRIGDKPFKSLEKQFENAKTQITTINLRGTTPVTVYFAAARVFVKSLNRKLLVVAIKYDDKKDFRYFAAIDMSWRALDVVRKYANRWLIEVFNQDWKEYGGWGRAACQQGIDGARRGVILSVLVDHALLIEPEQLRLAQANQPLLTAGTISRKVQTQSLLMAIGTIFDSENPKEAFKQFSLDIENLIDFRESKKHFAGRDFEHFEGSASLKKRYKNTA